MAIAKMSVVEIQKGPHRSGFCAIRSKKNPLGLGSSEPLILSSTCMVSTSNKGW